MKDYGLEDSEQMEQVWSLYVATGFYIYEQLCEVVNLLNLFQDKVFFPFILLLMKKNYCDEKPFYLFSTPYLGLSK